MNLQNSKLKNFTPLPNEIFSLHLTTGELAVYALLLRLENRETHECWPSYETIGKAIGKSKSSVKRYVAGLVEKGLITVEPMSVIMQNGLKKNGNLRYHIRPIREAMEWYIQHQLYLAEAAAERQQVQQQLADQAEKPRVRPCEPLCGLLRGGAASLPRRGISSRFRANFRGLPRLCGGQKQGSRRSPAKRVRWEEEKQRNDRVFAAFGGNEGYGACADEKQPAMDLSRDKNAEEMKQLQLEMGVAKQAHGA